MITIKINKTTTVLETVFLPKRFIKFVKKQKPKDPPTPKKKKKKKNLHTQVYNFTFFGITGSTEIFLTQLKKKKKIDILTKRKFFIELERTKKNLC